MTLSMEIYNKILASIQSGEYSESTALPSERFLCDLYHVSRSTIRQALEKLKADDYVYTVHGNGSYVKPQTFKQPLTRFYSFTDELKRNNIVMENNIIDYSIINDNHELNRKLNCPPGTSFHRLVRLRFAKDYPLMIETTFLPQNRFIKLDIETLKHRSLYEYLREKYAFSEDRATETFQPILPSAQQRQLLTIPSNVPCMLLERFGYEDDCLIEYTQSVVRGDKYIFSVDLG